MAEVMNGLAAIGAFLAGLGGIAGPILFWLDRRKNATKQSGLPELLEIPELGTEKVQKIAKRSRSAQRPSHIPKIVVASLVVFLLGAGFIVANWTYQAVTAEIVITIHPPKGAGPDDTGDIAGTVRGLDAPLKYQVVVYAFTDHWYVQPSTKQKLTYLGPSGRWSTQTHLGQQYAVFVVKPPYDPPTDHLPTIGGSVIAMTQVSADD